MEDRQRPPALPPGAAAGATLSAPPDGARLRSRAALLADLRALGVRAGDALMVHASLRAVGPVEGGADGVLDALDEAVGPDGTLLMVLGGANPWLPSDASYPARARLLASAPFDPRRTAAAPEVGWLAEAFRRRAGTVVGAHPIARFGARGRLAHALVDDAPWHDYFGPGSPLARLCDAGGRVLRLGADANTVTLLHHAEYLAALPHARRVRRDVLVATAAGAEARGVESLDDSDGVVDWVGDDYFALALAGYLDAGRGLRGRVGDARAELLDAGDLATWGARWMAAHLARAPVVVRGGTAHVAAAWDVVARCRDALAARGVAQWDDTYPTRAVVAADVAAGTLHVLLEEGRVRGAVTLDERQDPAYATVPWTGREPALVVHRLVVDPDAQGRGLGARLMAYAEAQAAVRGYASIRLDAYSPNATSVALYRRRGYREAGQVRFARRPFPFHCFERDVEAGAGADG